jgi:hypothetical protein
MSSKSAYLAALVWFIAGCIALPASVAQDGATGTHRPEPQALAREADLSLMDRWISTGVWCDQSTTTLEESGSAASTTEITQTVIGFTGRYYLNRALDARVELSGQRAQTDDAEIAFSEAMTGAMVLRYQPPGSRWLIQGGIGLPAGGELSTDQRTLMSWLSDPLLGLSTQNLSRGWSFHLGALGAYPLRPECSLYGGAGFQSVTAYEPVAGVSIAPGNRTSALAGFEMSKVFIPTIQMGVEVAIDMVGEETAEEVVIRGSHKLTSYRLYGGATVGPVRMQFAAGLSSADAYDWLSPDNVDTYLNAGPGTFTLAEITLTSARRFHSGESLFFSPLMTFGIRQFDPTGQPFGEGSAITITPGIVVGGFGPVVTVTYGFSSGSWLAPDDPNYEPDLSQTTLRAAVTWLPETETDNGTQIKR